MTGLLLALCVWGPAVSGEPQAEAAWVAVDADNWASWQERVSGMKTEGGLWSSFVEQRWFGFRKKPVELSGVLRYSPQLGLSLSYEGGDARTVILDTVGILLRDGRGRERKAPDKAEVSGLVRSMLALMTLDLDVLAKDFELRAKQEGAVWHLELRPREGKETGGFTAFNVQGAEAGITRLVFWRGERNRIEIQIGETRRGLVFEGPEKERYFR